VTDAGLHSAEPDRLAATVSALVGHRWTWRADELDGLVAAAGWTKDGDDGLTLTARTGLVGEPTQLTRVMGVDLRSHVELIRLPLCDRVPEADVGSADATRWLDQVLADTRRALDPVLGAPWHIGDDYAAWRPGPLDVVAVRGSRLVWLDVADLWLRFRLQVESAAFLREPGDRLLLGLTSEGPGVEVVCDDDDDEIARTVGIDDGEVYGLPEAGWRRTDGGWEWANPLSSEPVAAAWASAGAITDLLRQLTEVPDGLGWEAVDGEGDPRDIDIEWVEPFEDDPFAGAPVDEDPDA